MVVGIFGDPIDHTMSPYMQTKALEYMGIDGVYVPFHVQRRNLEAAVRGLVALGIRGVNVTIPHKSDVVQYLDKCSDAAEAVGAANTVINNDGVLLGDNTDIYGFMQGLTGDGGIEKIPSRCCVLGAGGGARGVVYGLVGRDEVEEIIVLNRTVTKAEELADRFSSRTGKNITAQPFTLEALKSVIPDCGLIVNTTTIGLYPDIDATPIEDLDLINDHHVVYDIIIPPLKSRLLTEAERRGARTINAVPMLAYQGARSLSLWTERESPLNTWFEL